VAAKKKKSTSATGKQSMSVYVVMLICSFVALALGSYLMYKEWERYNFDTEAKEYRASVSVVQPWQA